MPSCVSSSASDRCDRWIASSASPSRGARRLRATLQACRALRRPGVRGRAAAAAACGPRGRSRPRLAPAPRAQRRHAGGGADARPQPRASTAPRREPLPQGQPPPRRPRDGALPRNPPQQDPRSQRRSRADEGSGADVRRARRGGPARREHDPLGDGHAGGTRARRRGEARAQPPHPRPGLGTDPHTTHLQGRPTPEPTAVSIPEPPPEPLDLEALYVYGLELINEQRVAHGVSPVVLSDNTAAQAHAEELAAHCIVTHWSTAGLKPYMRYSLAGGYQTAAENVMGRGWCDGPEGDPVAQLERQIGMLMKSPGHRRALLGAQWRAVSMPLPPAARGGAGGTVRRGAQAVRRGGSVAGRRGRARRSACSGCARRGSDWRLVNGSARRTTRNASGAARRRTGAGVARSRRSPTRVRR